MNAFVDAIFQRRAAVRIFRGDHLRQDRDRDLFRSLRTDVESDRRVQSIDSVPGTTIAAVVAPEPGQAGSLAESEQRLDCLRECVDRLPDANRELLRQYHLAESQSKIKRRQGLAATLKLPAGALRLRVHRIRRQLKGCLEQCLAASDAMKHYGGAGH